MAMRRVAAVVVTLLVLAWASVAFAQTTTAPGGPTTSSDIDTSKCVSALPPPECGTKPTSAGDRGGSAQLALFGVLVAGFAVIGFVIVRSTRRNTIARSQVADRAP
ncbi:MAG TPA: hypothetical protein VF855_09155 [Acidimicrobiales bacterium]